VVKGLFRLLLRKSTVRLSKGNALIISAADRQTMQRLARQLVTTGAFTKRIPDIVKCVRVSTMCSFYPIHI
jgi:hypothetical protein